VRDLARDADEVAVVLPFEEAFLRSAGVNARFVGHPLMDRPPPALSHEAWARANRLDPARPVLGLFPGSREQEVGRHLELFSAAAARVVERDPRVQPVLGVPRGIDRAVYAGARWPLVESTGGMLLQYATAALVKSGTTTLEAGIAGTPMVVVYRMAPLSYLLARHLVKVPHIALANLIAERRVAPEFVQDAATPAALAEALAPLLREDSPERQAMVQGLAAIRGKLGGPGASARVAEMAATLLAARSPAATP
jgi:lipid-A-disaccharide synthase